MSFTNAEGNFEKINEASSGEITEDSDDSYQTEEEVLNGSILGSVTKLENISFAKKRKDTNGRIHKTKGGVCRLNVSVRCGKRNRFFKANKKSQKVIQKKICKKFRGKSKNCLEKPVETPKKGKRCRIGGKAKGKPPEEEILDKHESDEESENYFFSRISLGFFQKFKDLSGASTSNQWEEDYTKHLAVRSTAKVCDEIAEEMELLELQNWGMAKSEKLKKTEFLNPDTL